MSAATGGSAKDRTQPNGKPSLRCVLCGRRFRATQTPGTIYTICPACRTESGGATPPKRK